MGRKHKRAKVEDRRPGTLFVSISWGSGFSCGATSEMRILEGVEEVYVGFSFSFGDGRKLALLDTLPRREYEELWNLFKHAHFVQMRDCARCGTVDDVGGWSLGLKRPGNRTITISSMGGAGVPNNLAPLLSWTFEKHTRYRRRLLPSGIHGPEARALWGETQSPGDAPRPDWMLAETSVAPGMLSKEDLVQLFDRDPNHPTGG